MATPVQPLRGRNAERLNEAIMRLGAQLRESKRALEEIECKGPDPLRDTLHIANTALTIADTIRELEEIGRE